MKHKSLLRLYPLLGVLCFSLVSCEPPLICKERTWWWEDFSDEESQASFFRTLQDNGANGSFSFVSIPVEIPFDFEVERWELK